MQRFLAFTVEESLAGRGPQLKETLVGAAVFDRPPDYDPRTDGIVRVEARRLRSKLREYYDKHSAPGELRIEFHPGSYSPEFAGAPAPAAPPAPSMTRTIAVLPFASLAAPPETDYFADGLTQELIYMLTRVPCLRVIAWNSVNQLRRDSGTAADASERLRADTVLEGSVRRSGSRVRVNAQLTDAASGVVLWTQAFDRKLEDLLALQEEIARSIALALQVRFDAGQNAFLAHATGSLEAYSLYLQGRHAWNRRTEEGLRQSVVLFERAVATDPDCAVAHAGLADAYSLLCDFGFESAARSIPMARRAAERALVLDSTLAEAHNSLGFVVSMHDWDWAEGERRYLRAIELRPSYATAHHWYACDLLGYQSRWEPALAGMATAIALDPLEPSVVESENYIYLMARQYEEAERRYILLRQQWPGFWKTYSGLARVLSFQGRFAEAIEMLERSRAIVGDTPAVLAAFGHIHGMSGDRATARKLLERLSELALHRNVAHVTFAIAHLGTGERDRALDRLEQAAEARELQLVPIAVHPIYDELRGYARFDRLVKRIGLA